MDNIDRISQDLARTRQSFNDIEKRVRSRSKSKSKGRKKSTGDRVPDTSPGKSSIDMSRARSLLGGEKTPVTPTPGNETAADQKSAISRNPVFLKVEQRMQEK